MKKLIYLIPIFLGLVMTSCYKDEIDAINNRLEQIENTKIASLSEQVGNIKVSLAELEGVDGTLDAAIRGLDKLVSSLKTQLDANASPDASTKQELQTKIADAEAQIAQLTAADTLLDKKIADLKTYVDAELAKSKNWAESAFATLTQYYELEAALIALDDLIEKISNEYPSAITDAIRECETSMKAWVNKTLADSYYDMAAIDAKLNYLEGKITDGDAELAKQIDEQQKALQQAKSDLAKEYKQYIDQAIAAGGVIDKAIAAQIKMSQDNLQGQLNVITDRLDALYDRVNELESDFVNRIQSLKFIPEFSDRKVKFSSEFGAVLDFMVSPKNQAAALADAWNLDNSIVKACLRYTSDPLTRAVCEPIELTVASVTSNGKGDIAVVVKENPANPLTDDFWNGNQDAVVYLRISDSSNDIISELIDAVGYLPPPLSLSDKATANSYIVSQKGSYKFNTVKGNSSESVGVVASAEVLWESFGTDVTPNVGDLVKNVSYKDGEVTFQTADTFKEGNAVIAAKDASGTILWSWHIWFTDEPQGQVYYNNAGTIMDRNLGATSATPGDVGALGLLYQWGRKDPFLGSSSIYISSEEAASTITWPSAVSSDSSSGTIAYATANPTTFITDNNNDWYYTGSSSTDNTRWTTSDKDKSIYDPCPAGWRVPDGGIDGVWSKALGSSSSFTNSSLYNSTNEGINFSGNFGSASTIWYPASGYRHGTDGSLLLVGYFGNYWSASNDNGAYYLFFDLTGYVKPWGSSARAFGNSVRCLQESK